MYTYVRMCVCVRVCLHTCVRVNTRRGRAGGVFDESFGPFAKQHTRYYDHRSGQVLRRVGNARLHWHPRLCVYNGHCRSSIGARALIVLLPGRRTFADPRVRNRAFSHFFRHGVFCVGRARHFADCCESETVCIHIYLHIYTYIYICICMYIYICIYIHVYIYIYTSTYIYMYVCQYTYRY